MTTAASEEYGLDVEHVETLQQAFDNFLAQLQGKRTFPLLGSFIQVYVNDRFSV